MDSVQPNDLISPDDKDWTWVLDRPCPECGFDARGHRRERLGAEIRANAAQWPHLLAHEHVARRPVPSRWSALEYGCHVRDVFDLFLVRLNLMLAEDGPLFANWDQDVTAIEQRYSEQDPAAVSEEIVVAAERLAAAFDGVSGATWHRTGFRSDGAAFTVESFGSYLLHDPVHHLWDVDNSGLGRSASG